MVESVSNALNTGILFKITDKYRNNMHYFSCNNLMHFISPTDTLVYQVCMIPLVVESL